MADYYPPSKTEPWDHQRQAFRFLQDRKYGMLAMEPGCGKSKVAVDLATYGYYGRVLVLCPKSVIKVWKKQFALHAVPSFHVFDLDGSGTLQKKLDHLKYDWLETEQEWFKGRTPSSGRAVIIHYEASYQGPFPEWLKSIHWDLIILDESHRIKSPTGKTFKLVQSLKASFKLALTGTPMPHSPLDIWAQAAALHPMALNPNYYAFKARYTVNEAQLIAAIRNFKPQKDYSHLNDLGALERAVNAELLETYQHLGCTLKHIQRWRGNTQPVDPFRKGIVTAYINQEELDRRVRSFAFFVKAADVLDLPPVMHEVLLVDMPAGTRKHYRELAQDYYTALDNGEVTADNVLARLTRFQQLTGGFVAAEDGTIQKLDTAKADALAEALEDIDPNEPIVIFYRFQEDRYTLMSTLGTNRTLCYLHGGKDDTAKWESGEANTFLVQVQAGGVGIDLTRARIAFLYSLGFVSPGEYDQILARLMRPGQTRPVMFYHLITDKSVDVKIEENREQRRGALQPFIEKGSLETEWAEIDPWSKE